MIHHTCQDCQRGFQATSREEAEEEARVLKQMEADYGRMDFEQMVDQELVAYARFCPYCGGDNVEAI